MVEPQIIVEALSKTYRVATRAEGLGAAFKSLIKRHYDDVKAIREINFTIDPGEIVGFIGPNGAGKTTTLKMLSGLLYPSSGRAIVSGFTPWERKDDFLRNISMILGNKSQMLWDIPPLDTFRVLGEIYRVPKDSFNKTLDELVSLLEMEDLLSKPVRNLSLGERMKCELVAGLLHQPRVIFLDEPTLGLDISMQTRLRKFMAAYNKKHQATIILTSHYMADVVTLCKRVILIHHGQLLYDGDLVALSEKLAPYKLINLTLPNGNQIELDLPQDVEILSHEDGHFSLRVSRKDAAKLTSHLLNNYIVNDLTVENPPIEAVIDQIYIKEIV